jgi:hypothetical protein
MYVHFVVLLLLVLIFLSVSIYIVPYRIATSDLQYQPHISQTPAARTAPHYEMHRRANAHFVVDLLICISVSTSC